MVEHMPGLDAFCEAVRSGDAGVIDARRKDFVSRNWVLVSTLDQLANADLGSGNYLAAARKLALMQELAPDVAGFLLRRTAAELRAGVPGAAEALAASAPRLTSDNEMFHAVQELLAHGQPALAADVTAACAGRPGFSPGIIAAAKARVLAATGRLGAAIEALGPEMAADRPNLIAMRCCYLLLEQALDFGASRRLCRRAALMWGEERDLRHLADHLAYSFEFDAVATLAAEAAALHPGLSDAAASLARNNAAARAPADAAAAKHGPPEDAAADEVFAVLSAPDSTASQVLWGKQALVALLGSARLTAAEYARFAWYLPNWEEGRARNLVLAAARQRCPDAPAVQRGWLNHLIGQSAYADAAGQCRELLRGARDDDALFYAILLLRLQQDGVAPAFMDDAEAASLRTAALAQMAQAGPGFRCVMHAHIAAIGGDPGPWPDDGMPPPGTPDGLGFRRLFAAATGRLPRVTTGGQHRAQPPSRPVLAVSGQLRGFEAAWASIHAHLCAPTGAPVVLSVWDRSVNATGRHAQRLERALPDSVIAQLPPEERFTDRFEAAYPKTYALLFGATAVDAHALRRQVDASGCTALAVETESEDLIARLVHPYISPNMLKMYYKFARVEDLVQEAEAQSGQLFTHVIWTRPDCSIQRLDPADLRACLARADLAWSSFTTETSFGDYVMVLPRRAFAAIAGVFPRVVTAGDTVLLPWRPNRHPDPAAPRQLGAFGGPDVLFDTLLSNGYLPLHRIPRILVRLLGRTPGADAVRACFKAEQHAAGRGQAGPQ